MPTFKYDAYRNPYGPSIAEALADQGRVTAAEALRIGELQANAAQQRGAIQAQMWGTAANAIGAIPQQMRANKELALREEQQRRQGEIQGMQLEDAHRQRAAEERIGAAYESARGADGSVDFEKFQAQIPGADMRYAQPLISAADQSATRRQNLTAKKLAAVQDVAGGMLQSGDLSPASVTEFLNLGRQNGVFTDAQVAGHVQSMADDPKAAKRVLLGIVGPQKPIEQDPDKPLIHPLTGDVITPAPGKPVVNEFKQADHVAGPTGEPLMWNSKTGWFQNAAGDRVTDVRVAAPPVKPGEGQHVINGQLVGPEGQRIGAPIPKQADPASAGDVTDLTAAGLDAAALNYAKTGLLPPLGMGDKTTRKAIINRAAEMMPGLDIASAKADYSANTDSLRAMQKQRDAIGAFEQTAKKNIDIFLEQAGKVVDTGSPLANSLVRHVSGQMLGSPDQTGYDAARQVAVNEIAKIVSNPTLAGTLSDSARHEVEAFNPGTATLKQSVAVMRLLKRDMDNRTASLDDGIAGIKARISKGAPEPSGGKVKILSITPVP